MNKFPIPRVTPMTKQEQKAASRKADIDEKVAALRKATGKTETRTLSCVCSRTGRHFTAVFERFSGNHKFQISRIEEFENSTMKKGSSVKGLLAGSMQEAKSFDANEFNFFGWVCPFCRNDRPIHCGKCGDFGCGDRIHVVPDGREMHACHDACGNSGPLVPLERISATGGGSGPSAMSSTKNSPKKDRPRLTGKDNLRLDRPR